jgi:hypothetical protein
MEDDIKIVIMFKGLNSYFYQINFFITKISAIGMCRKFVFFKMNEKIAIKSHETAQIVSYKGFIFQLPPYLTTKYYIILQLSYATLYLTTKNY